MAERKSVVMGIDPSINSIGVSFNIDNGKHFYFYIITPLGKMTKVQKSWNDDNPTSGLKYMPYIKTEIGEMESYHEREVAKMGNFMQICETLSVLIKRHKPDKIRMEGIAYGSASTVSVIDLAGLNYMIRMLAQTAGIPFYIVSPSELKKYATGKGNADKNMMVQGFILLFDEFKNIKKIDDIADAYYLSTFSEPKKNVSDSTSKQLIQLQKPKTVKKRKMQKRHAPKKSPLF